LLFFEFCGTAKLHTGKKQAFLWSEGEPPAKGLVIEHKVFDPLKLMCSPFIQKYFAKRIMICAIKG
jgi:hypothetical protein